MNQPEPQMPRLHSRVSAHLSLSPKLSFRLCDRLSGPWLGLSPRRGWQGKHFSHNQWLLIGAVQKTARLRLFRGRGGQEWAVGAA